MVYHIWLIIELTLKLGVCHHVCVTGAHKRTCVDNQNMPNHHTSPYVQARKKKELPHTRRQSWMLPMELIWDEGLPLITEWHRRMCLSQIKCKAHLITMWVDTGTISNTKNYRTHCSTYPAEGSHLMFALFLYEDWYVHDDTADQYDVVNVRWWHLNQSTKTRKELNYSVADPGFPGGGDVNHKGWGC